MPWSPEANEAGGRDNITAVVVDIVGAARSADETPTLTDQPAVWPGGPAGPAGPAGWGGPVGSGRRGGHLAQSWGEQGQPEDVGLLGLGLISPDPDGFGRGDR